MQPTSAQHPFDITLLRDWAPSIKPTPSNQTTKAELDALRQSLLESKMRVAEVRLELRWRAFKRKYSSDQPRAPSGNPDGGQWTSEGAGGTDPRMLSDAIPDNDAIVGAQYAGNGHHSHPRANYKNLPLPPETRKVFDEATSGPIHIRGHQFDDRHRHYNEATKELMDRFMSENNISPERMTPDQARSLLRSIDDSPDPRIRNYHRTIRFLRQLYRLRTGRGSE